jgi:hypothetical protein
MRKAIVSLILLWTLSFVIILPFCSATTEPSVPEFTLRYVDNSYNVPSSSTSTTDPYTGKVTTSTVPGYLVENKSVYVIITNPSFTSYKDENGSDITLFYHVLFKGHFEETWRGLPNYPEGYNSYDRNSSVTLVPVPVYNVSAGGQVDVEVRALIGKFVTVYDPPAFSFSKIGSHEVFVGEASAWSPIKTITISNGSSVFFGLGWLGLGAIVVVAVLLVALAMFLFKRKGNAPQK